MTRNPVPFVCLAAVLALSSCSGKDDRVDPLKVDRPADQIYSEATKALKENQYQKAVTLFSEVERQHPYSEYATQAQIKSAEASYDALQYDDAIIALDRFIELHPGHEQVAYAYYLKAMCYYEQIADVARDQEMTRLALEALNTVIGRFPESSYARDATYKRDLTLDHLAGKEMEVGRYYLKQGEVNAAINRFLNVVRNYQTTTHTPEALHRLVESYTILGLKDEATHVAAVLGHNYPGSKWYEDSFVLLDPSQRATLEDKRSWVGRTLDSLLKDE
jgi:outer membrane protein assembly factor BamD